MNTLLFLCTGNYYRSRFAEEYFNHHMRLYQLPWSADSMGIMRDFEGNGNVGPISRNTLNELERLGISASGQQRMPKHVDEKHFYEFDRVIAMSKAEHQPMLESIWSLHDKNVEYFDVEDLHVEGPETALPRLCEHLDALIREIR